jgi:hypothetical protein
MHRLMRAGIIVGLLLIAGCRIDLFETRRTVLLYREGGTQFFGGEFQVGDTLRLVAEYEEKGWEVHVFIQSTNSPTMFSWSTQTPAVVELVRAGVYVMKSPGDGRIRVSITDEPPAAHESWVLVKPKP